MALFSRAGGRKVNPPATRVAVRRMPVYSSACPQAQALPQTPRLPALPYLPGAISVIDYITVCYEIYSMKDKFCNMLFYNRLQSLLQRQVITKSNLPCTKTSLKMHFCAPLIISLHSQTLSGDIIIWKDIV